MKASSLVAVLALLASCRPSEPKTYISWPVYLGGTDRNHYTTLAGIDTNNVNKLKVAWTYTAPDEGQMQMSPIMVNGKVYGVTASLKAFALNASTGDEIWIYKDSGSVFGSSRGVSYWEDGADKRIFYAVGPNLVALNAETGKLIQGFGNNGKVDLHTGLPESARNKYITSNTPGTVYRNLIVMPVRVGEDASAAPGDIRAFDTRTGKLVWSFHTIPHPGEKGYETWPADAYKNVNIGGVNNWCGMALDEKTGTLFVPTGSASPDFYGANRKGTNLFANCMLALNADDGSYKWHYQIIHHDMWDRDLAAPPNLITVTKNGRKIDAVAQVTKHGYTYVFDRNTGEPLFPIEEVAAPASVLPGEEAWPTQPLPVLPKPFARAAYQLTENDLSPYANNKEALLKIFRESDKRMFAPPSTNNMLLLPGYDGGAEFGGAGADPGNGILYVNSNEMAWYLKMDRREDATGTPGNKLYINNCSACHGKDRMGNALSGYPNLTTLKDKYSQEQVLEVVSNGKGKMPGFSQLSTEEKKDLADFLFGIEKKKEIAENLATTPQDAYLHSGYEKFLDDKGLPGISPPWGTLTAIDLNSGNHLWQVTLGITESLPNQDTNPTGCESYGGPIITENGLLLIAGTKDGMFRAFNRFTGKMLLQTKLPAASFATPAMYAVNGKQYIVMACGGEKLGTPKGNKVVAYALE